jgi:hypothetical protein
VDVIRAFAIAVVVLTACTAEVPILPPLAQPESLFTINEAVRILGEPAHLSDSATAFEDNVTLYKCTFTADTLDPAGKLGNVYFMYEEYGDVRSAEKVYRDIHRDNKGHDGVEVIDNLADEAYFHTDSENFCFVLVRKANRMIRLKVNKLTSNTSLDDFHSVTREMADRI